jgi:hypothetical protein
MTEGTARKQKDGPLERVVRVTIDPNKSKDIGGGEHGDWNNRLMCGVLNALPTDRRDTEAQGKVGTALFSGAADLKATDPIEGMLVGQIMVAHEAALFLYQRAWSQPPGYFEEQRHYLQMADRAQRTLTILTERLDRHRGAGQQQITVKHQHVTVNADQAIVGNVEHHRGVGPESQSKDQPHAITYAPGITMQSADQAREPLPIAGNEKRTVPDARRDITGRSERKS